MGGGGSGRVCWGGGGSRWGDLRCWAMKQRILGLRTPPCHRRPVIATQSSISSSYCALITTGMFLCVPAHRSALLAEKPIL